jgi:copper(I)-binding protein
MKMTPVAWLPLAPGSYHIMLSNLTHARKPGDRFPVTSHFARTGGITVIALVEKAGTGDVQGPTGSSTPGMKM